MISFTVVWKRWTKFALIDRGATVQRHNRHLPSMVYGHIKVGGAGLDGLIVFQDKLGYMAENS